MAYAYYNEKEECDQMGRIVCGVASTYNRVIYLSARCQISIWLPNKNWYMLCKAMQIVCYHSCFNPIGRGVGEC